MKTFVALTEISYHFGLIGVDEFTERMEILRWLMDESGEIPDPRLVDEESVEEDLKHEYPKSVDKSDSENDNDGIMYFIPSVLSKTWVFTKSDPDSYPSVPHGHLENKNRSWPKLNPYTGRAFAAKHRESRKLRLGKDEMKALWRDDKFRDFSRSAVMWYMEEFPFYAFPVRNPLRFPKW